MRRAHDHRRPAGDRHSGLWPLCFRFCVSAVGPAVATGGTIASMWRAVDWKPLIGMLGCASALVEPVAQPAKGANDVGRPWMFSEASLPAGFPAPGPVGEVIVKTYPAHRMARAAAGKGANGMFMKLFRHIERNEIAMTAPVVMGWPAENAAEGGGDAAGKQPATQGPESMAFLYGKPTLGAAGVDPADPVVLTETVVVSVGLRGSYDEATMNRGLERLRAWLGEHPEWTVAGAPRSLAYNSPFVPGFAKYSEVQLPVIRATDERDGRDRKPE
ncbi:MAG: hypothetical protein EBS56_03190 [Planctomycetia bacterium]|nr:hypothetical protein [Planctomycetia bacterium]